MVKRTRAWAKKFLTHEKTAWYQMEVLTQLRSKLDFEPSIEGMTMICCSDFDRARNLFKLNTKRRLWFERVWGFEKNQGLVRCKDASPCRSSWKELYSMRDA